jgi:hypothetical protein
MTNITLEQYHKLVAKQRLKATTPARITEEVLQDQFIKFANALGWTVAHFRPAMLKDGTYRTAVSGDGKGFPDNVCVHPQQGRVIYAELKSKTGALSVEQKMWRDILLAAGQEWHCWKPSDWEEIERVLRGKY